MAPAGEDLRQSIEPLFLSRALESGVRLRVGQMNRTDHDGTIRDIGRYEINLDENGRIVTLLKQEISFLSAPRPVLAVPAPEPSMNADHPSTAASSPGKPNIQQEFLDRAIRENQPLTVFLVNGQRIRAHLEAYDNFTLLFREGERQHLFYKHAITTINR